DPHDVSGAVSDAPCHRGHLDGRGGRFRRQWLASHRGSAAGGVRGAAARAVPGLRASRVRMHVLGLPGRAYTASAAVRSLADYGGLIHRDIKPTNIITCERGGVHDVAKLLDFGLVRSSSKDAPVETLTQEGTFAGTPAYMSPEQADGKTELVAPSDIYSLGAV